MAQLGLGVAGALVGNMIAPGIGGSIGFAIGSYAGGMIDRAMQKPVQGPRLSDLSVTSSAYGSAIPEIQGTVRLAGNMTWSTGLVENKKTTSGKSAPRQDIYTYKASFAISFCRGPVARVMRIWLDKKLAYDATASGRALGVTGIVWRFYTGSEVQLPDRSIVAKDGANAPAYRGQCYIVFDAVDLAPFGNRIPNIEAEITTDAAETDVTTTVTNLSTGNGNPFSSPTHASAFPVVDWERGIALRGWFGSSTNGIGVSDIVNGLETRVQTQAQMRDGTTFATSTDEPRVLGITPGGAAYWAGWNPVARLTRFDPETLTVTGEHPCTPSGTNWDRWDQLQGCAVMATSRIVYEGSPRELLLYTSIAGNVRIIDAGTMESIWGMTEEHAGDGVLVDAPSFPFRGGDCSVGLVGGEQRLGQTDIWLLTSGTALSSGTTDDKKPRLQRIEVGIGSFFSPTAGLTTNLSVEATATLDPATIHPSATVVQVSGLQYDPSDNCLVFVSKQLTGTGDTWRLVKVDSTGDLVWTKTLQGNPEIPAGLARLDGSHYAVIATATGQLFELRSGTSQTFTNANTSGAGYIFDSASLSAVATYGTSTLKRIYPARATATPVPLADVVTWLCAKAGLGESDIDVSLLSGNVRGFVRGQEPVRDSLQQLRAAYFFDPVEEDDVLKFRPRGGAAVASIAFADVLRRQDDSPALTIRQADDTDLPRRLWVDYRDVDKDQQSNAMAWSRALAPTVLVNGVQETRLNLSALVLTASEAKTIAMRAIMAAYAERYTVQEMGLTFAHLALNAGDAVTLELPDGTTQRVLFKQSEIGDDYTLSVEAVFEDASIFTLETTGSSGDGHVTQTVPAAYATRILWANLPLLDERDDAGGIGLRFYLGAGGYGTGWLGAALFDSADRSAWDRIATLRTGMTWGSALNTLAAPPSAFLTDRTNTLRVVMHAGATDLEDATEIEMLNGANRALLIAADGSAEVIAFSDVTANGDGSYTLATLLRGQRGTEWACAGHAPGDVFVLLTDAIEPHLLPLASLAAVRYARAVGRFDTFDATTPIGRTITGAAEKPYAPVLIEGARDGSSNLTITWERRTRIGGEWLDLTEAAPLGEATEAYVVEIMDGTDVARTITGLTAPTTTYSAADQTTDFGSAQPAIAVRIYQISATVGRGYPGSATI